jgi:hypothetical protein
VERHILARRRVAALHKVHRSGSLPALKRASAHL